MTLSTVIQYSLRKFQAILLGLASLLERLSHWRKLPESLRRGISGLDRKMHVLAGGKTDNDPIVQTGGNLAPTGG